MLECVDVMKIYFDPVTEYRVPALRGINMTINEGELVSIIGPSGAGKTTLTNLLSGNDTPSGGMITVNGQRLDMMTNKERRKFRFENIGMVNQFIGRNIFARLTVEENLLMLKKMFYQPREKSKKEVKELLELLNLSHVKDNKATKISGGEAMRLSLGAALAKHDNPILLADEPTGQLDTKNTLDVIESMRNINKETGKTVLVVTHDIRFRNVFEKSYLIQDGRLVSIQKDSGKQELGFLHASSSLKKVHVDSSNLVRIPDTVRAAISLRSTAEFEVHPSRKLAVMWNPENYRREEILETLTKSEDDQMEEGEEGTQFDDVKHLFSRVFEPTRDTNPIIEINELKKGYESESGFHLVLKSINLTINQGDFIFISGPSGVGKTTLMNLLAGLLKQNEGTIRINGFDLGKADDDVRADFRLRNIAFITQLTNLFNPIPVRDNMIIPFLFLKSRYNKVTAKETAVQCMIDHKMQYYPDELSSGERQRASLAVALNRYTPILLADEPTANVDSELARIIINLLIDTIKLHNTTMIICSHDLTLLRPGFRHLMMDDGKFISDVRVTEDYLKDVIMDYLRTEKDKKKAINH